ncbi:MAG: hypothetical protein LC749_07910, partial [Actinobacteria bacterium]|nr:hypothetical protein [Actinomycetota bacterium]
MTNECYLSLFSTSQSTEEKLGSVVTCHETYHMWRRGTPGPPMTMELQGSNSSYITPQAMEMLYALTVARGIKGINFYMFVGGENPPGFDNVTGKTYDVSAPIALDNSERPHGAVIRKLAKVTRSIGESLRYSEPLRDLTLGWYVPYESALLVADDAAMPDVTRLLNMFNTGDFGLSDAMSLQALMVLSSVSFGCVDLERDEDVLADSKQLWVGTADFMSREVQERLARYVQGGGHLVLMPTIPRTDDAMQPCEVLLDLVLGDGERPRFPDSEPRAALLVETIQGRRGEILIAPGPVTRFELPVDAEPVAWLAQGHVPCAFTRPVGDGRVTVIGFQLQYMPTESPDQKNFLVDLVEGDGHSRHAWTAHPQLTAMQLGSSGDGFLCVVNPVDIPASTKVTYSTPSGERESLPVVLDGMGFTGRDARLLPVSLDLGSGLELRHSTWELIGRDRKDTAFDLSF